MRDNDFHLNEPQNESTIQTSTQLLGRQEEEIKESDGPIQAQNLTEALIKSETEAKISDLRKKRTGVIDESYLSSESDEDSMRLQLSESSIDEIEDGYGYIYRFEKRK
ncbi:uncharacterized protein LOC112459350 [Temnothorax curvispinosus]|uniref:Uncharacterized protein LOC112459350 n=1 Tax=Temnothorax curvispinosus TaxID=300111 RepID=A0A6J1QCV4_9HYME|nr:uncharacterized protein LOC112459350 [Temnothorax curvispinosus]